MRIVELRSTDSRGRLSPHFRLCASSMLNASPDRGALEIESRKSSAIIGHFRWVICAVLLFGTTKNYMDRQVIGILKNTLQHQFGWGEIDYSNLVLAFQAAYAIGMV